MVSAPEWRFAFCSAPNIQVHLDGRLRQTRCQTGKQRRKRGYLRRMTRDQQCTIWDAGEHTYDKQDHIRKYPVQDDKVACDNWTLLTRGAIARHTKRLLVTQLCAKERITLSIPPPEATCIEHLRTLILLRLST